MRLDTDFVAKYGLTGLQAKWTCYADKKFENMYDGKDFTHVDLIGKTGWAMCYIKGIFPRDVAYIKLELLNPSTGMLVRSFYFEFRKSYQTSLDARYYVEDPVLHTKIVKNGTLTELKKGTTSSGEVRYKRAKSTFKQMKIRDIFHDTELQPVECNVITQTKVRYTEKPKMINRLAV